MADGEQLWYINGKRHRTDGPAIVSRYGVEKWYLNGELHREDGPAVEWINGEKEWWINNNKLTEHEFNAYHILKNIKRLI